MPRQGTEMPDFLSDPMRPSYETINAPPGDGNSLPNALFIAALVKQSMPRQGTEIPKKHHCYHSTPETINAPPGDGNLPWDKLVKYHNVKQSTPRQGTEIQ